MKQLLLRMDDITPDMNWKNFERVCSVCDQNQIKPILGVVPDNRDAKLSAWEKKEDFWGRMRALADKGYTLSQHGYRHTYVTKKSGLLGINPFSEFAGLSYEEQRNKLKEGQAILQEHGIHATMFMAPGHTFDRKTLKALKSLGFTEVTDGYSSKLYKRAGLVFYPCTLAGPRMPKALDTICLHVNHMSDEELSELEKFIAKNKDLFTDVKSLSGQKTVSYIGVCLEEKKNLFLRKCKRFAAENPRVQSYLQKTDDPNGKVKRRKRICGLPKLFFSLVFHRK